MNLTMIILKKIIQNTTMCTWVQITVGGAGVRHGSVNGNYSCSHFNDDDVSCIHVMIFLHLLRSSQLREISTGGQLLKTRRRKGGEGTGAGMGVSEKVSVVGFCLGSGLFGNCNSN